MTLPDQEVRKIVVQQGLVDEKTLGQIEAFSKETKIPLAEALVKKEAVTDEQMGTMVASAMNIPFVALSKLTIPDQVAKILPVKVAKRKKAIPFARDNDGVKVAMANPKETALLSMIARKTGQRAIAYYATENDIVRTLEAYKENIQKSINDLIPKGRGAPVGEAPVAKIVDNLIYAAYQDRASDIHIEPEKEASLVRFRVDGVLQDILRLPQALHDRAVTRIKVLSNLRTDEHLSAQDGKMRMELAEEDLDIRVSIVPITQGEKVVLRLLSSKSRDYTLSDLGMNPNDLAKITRAMNESSGMILSTGPTGSGKTTTIYAILKIINTREKNITSVEDPVEYKVKGANQIQVNPKTNLTFASGLRSILRQDPNIIFVGEIRDSETAGIAVNAALTGHLVLSTLHTNDAATTIPRLIDMKVEPYLVASTVSVVIAQRLVRKICNYCKASGKIPTDEITPQIPEPSIAKHFTGSKEKKISVFHGKGCRMCRSTGYSGRIGIFEVLEIKKDIRKLIVAKADGDDIMAQAIESRMTTMTDDGLEKVAKGITTIEEVLRVTKVEPLETIDEPRPIKANVQNNPQNQPKN